MLMNKTSCEKRHLTLYFIIILAMVLSSCGGDGDVLSNKDASADDDKSSEENLDDDENNDENTDENDDENTDKDDDSQEDTAHEDIDTEKDVDDDTEKDSQSDSVNDEETDEDTASSENTATSDDSEKETGQDVDTDTDTDTDTVVETDSTEETTSDTAEDQDSETDNDIDPVNLCEETGGEWQTDSCGHYKCGVEPPCYALIPGCDCGEDSIFDKNTGCVISAACGSTCPDPNAPWISYIGDSLTNPEICEEIEIDCAIGESFSSSDCGCGCMTPEDQYHCEDSGGEWMWNSCGDYRCGEPPDCAAIIPGCNCGSDSIVNSTTLRCEVSEECTNRCAGLSQADCVANPNCNDIQDYDGVYYECIEDMGCGDAETCATNGESTAMFPDTCIPSGWTAVSYERCEADTEPTDCETLREMGCCGAGCGCILDGAGCIMIEGEELGLCLGIGSPTSNFCWTDDQCDAGQTCQGAIICPCGADCDEANRQGECV